MDYQPFAFAIFLISLLVHNAKGYTCEVKVEKVGCFNDKSRPLDKLLVYRRTTYNHEEQRSALPRLLCDCAIKAHLQGYSYIGLQYYAECWSSSKTEPDYSRDGPSTSKCFNAEFRQCSQNDTECAGGARANIIYKIIYPDEATSELNETPAITEATAPMKLLQSTPPGDETSVPIAPTFQGTEQSKQPSSEENVQITEPTYTSPATEEPSTPSVPTSQITESTPAFQTTDTPSSEISEKTPSTVVPTTAAKPPCEDKLTNCAEYVDYCTEEYPYMIAQCPKTCNQGCV